MSSPTEVPWIKASASSGAGQCVEMRRTESAIDVRDSKNPDGPVLVLTRRQWQSFIDGLKIGIDDE